MSIFYNVSNFVWCGVGINFFTVVNNGIAEMLIFAGENEKGI